MRHYAKLLPAMFAASLMLMAEAGAAVAGSLEDGKVAAEHQLPMSELEPLRAKLISLWNPPQAVNKNPDQYVVTIRIRLSRDHMLVGQPEVLNSGEGPLFEATRDSAIQAVIQGQPYNMLSSSTYDVWKEMTLNFNPRDVYMPAPPKTPREDLAFYPEYVPSSSVTAAAGCEEPLLTRYYLGLRWKRATRCTKQVASSNLGANARPCSSNARPRIFCSSTTSNGSRTSPTGRERAWSCLPKKAN